MSSSLYFGPTITMLIQSLYNLFIIPNKENLSNTIFYTSLHVFGFWNTMIYSLLVKLHDLDINKINIIKTKYESLNIELIQKIQTECNYYIDYFNAIIDKLIEINWEYIDEYQLESYKKLLMDYNTFLEQYNGNKQLDLRLPELPQPTQAENELIELMMSLQKMSSELNSTELIPKPANLTRAQRRLLKKQKKNK